MRISRIAFARGHVAHKQDPFLSFARSHAASLFGSPRIRVTLSQFTSLCLGFLPGCTHGSFSRAQSFIVCLSRFVCGSFSRASRMVFSRFAPLRILHCLRLVAFGSRTFSPAHFADRLPLRFVRSLHTWFTHLDLLTPLHIVRIWKSRSADRAFRLHVCGSLSLADLLDHLFSFFASRFFRSFILPRFAFAGLVSSSYHTRTLAPFTLSFARHVCSFHSSFTRTRTSHS